MSLPEPLDAPDAHDALLKLEAQQREWDMRAREVQGKAAQAYARLVDIALHSQTGQAQRVALFLAAAYNGSAYQFDLFDLRAVDVEISDDMLVCIDALRWGRADLYNLLPGGDAPILEIIRIWQIGATSDS